MTNYFGNFQWRGYFFNKIISELNYTSYLELGVSTGEYSWNIVECPLKVGVDSNQSINIPGVINCLTDEYFETLDKNTKFDLIYIDAYHEKNQVCKDFCNSIKHLNKGGMIILHDIFPLNEEYSNEMWNGSAYQFWIDLVKHESKQTFSFIGFPGDPGGTVGIYLKTNYEFDDSRFTEFNYPYNYFLNNLPKYIYHKAVTEEEVIFNAKHW